MTLSYLLQKWSGIDQDAKIRIITDEAQKPIAEAIQNEHIYPVDIALYSDCTPDFSGLKELGSHDLAIILLSMDTYMTCGANRYFSAFNKPDWLAARYIFVRLGISLSSLLQGLSTAKTLIQTKMEDMRCLDTEKAVTVTSECGTDISFRIKPFTTCSHEITCPGGMAFLPPSEISAEILTETANGTIAVDMTVGQLYHYNELIEYFGLVQKPVMLTVKNGLITEITGHELLREKLFSLPADCRKLVELGQGLSCMEPTGLIGVDESILASCHFGFGEIWTCGTHLDFCIHTPHISQ